MAAHANTSVQRREDPNHPVGLTEFLARFQKAEVREVTNQCAAQPLVSVIVTTYNHGRFIGQALDSILAQQTDFPVEICVGDDDSRDGARDICLDYAAKHPDRIRLFLHSRANNLAIDGRPTGRFNLVYLNFMARGRYIAMCEGDDCWTHPGKLAAQVAFLEKNSDFAACFHNGVVLWEDSGKTMRYLGMVGRAAVAAHRQLDRDVFTTRELLSPVTFIPTASLMFRAEGLRALPAWFFEIFSADIAIASILSRGGKKIKFLDLDGCLYRKHDGGVSAGLGPLDIYRCRKPLYERLSEFHGHQFEPEYARLVERHRQIARKWAQDNLLMLPEPMRTKAREFLECAIEPVTTLRRPPERSAADMSSLPDRSPAMTHAAPHPFTNPPLEINNVDLYWTRESILRAVREAAPQFHGVFLDIGCGVMPYRDIIRRAAPRLTRYVGLDIETPIYKAEVDLRWDGRKIPLKDASVDSAMLTEVLEHCPEPWVVLKEARRVLKPGGVLFFTVPYIWPLHDAPWDFFRYTPFALEKLLAEAGFADVKLQALGGWNASLAQMIGLWLKRAPLAAETRQKMARELWPLFQELVRTDQLPVDPKAGNTMATGWTGLAHVPAAAAPVRRTAGDLPVVLVRSHEFNYSETFVEDHVDFLSSNLTLVYGFPFPRFLRGGKSVLPAATEEKIQVALSGKSPITSALWAEYSAGLAQFLAQSGAKSALVETGLMGAFVHEACEEAKLPFVVHFHGVDAFGRELLERWLPNYRKFFQTTASVAVVSKAMHAQLLQLGAAPERTLLAPYGVAIDLPALAAPAKAPPHFVAVGRFVEKKAPHLTLQAFAAVHRAVPEARLVMIGDGPLLPACQQWAAENGVADAVTFAGVRSREEVSRRMAASRVFVQHSVVAANGDSEGLPLAVLEAGAHALPVVSTRHAGIPDAVREGVDGFLVTENDVTAMAEAMLRLAHDGDLAARLGASFRERVVAHYSRERSLERLHAILVAASEGRSPRELDASASVPSAPEPLTPRQLIAEDRNNLNAYLNLAATMLDAGKLSGAYLAVAEAHRLSGGSVQTTEALTQLESHGVLDDPQIQIFRARAGWTSRPPNPNPRRILVVTNLLPPQEMGGYGRTVWEFSRELLARGHTVRVLTADMPHLLRKPTAEHETFEKNVRRSLRLFGDWVDGTVVAEPDMERRKAIARENHQTILREIDEFGADAIMAGNLDFVGHFFVQVALDRGIPVLHRLGNAYPGYEPAQSPQGPLFCLAGCSAWVNEGIRAKGYPISRYEVVPPGSPLAEYFRAWAPQRDRLRIAYAGLLMPYKGAHVLVNALAHLARAGIDFECTLAGDTTRPEYLETMRAVATEHAFSERLHFPGFLGKAELAALYARSNVLVFPSVFEEPFGKTQIEAMAAGLLVISSGSGGASEIVEHGKSGLLFKAGDARALAERLAAAARHPAAAEKIALAGQARAFEFTTEASVDRIEAVFDEMLNVAGRARAAAVAT